MYFACQFTKEQRQGFAKEAAGACRDWAFEQTPFGVLYSYMKESNVASSATAMSCGMKLVDRYQNAQSEPTVVYAITREEWMARKGNALPLTGNAGCVILA